MSNISNFHNELQIIINQQAILSQKVGILLTINTIFISTIISISYIFSYFFLILIFFPILSLILNIYILYPKFKNGTSSKYFFDYAQMTKEEIKFYLNNSDYEIESQIQINSKILKNKYNLYRHSLAINFWFLPHIVLLFKK